MISVVIPVFNARNTLEKSIESVICLTEVGEVILIDDGSTDDSYELCLSLQKLYNKVKVLRHKNAKNKGAAATRNLGIINAEFDLIAFLDSDDLYLKNRFHGIVEKFEKLPEVDGFYGVSMEVFASERSRELFYRYRDKIITKMDKYFSPEDLFEAIFYGVNGEFHISTLTIKKSALMEVGLFNKNIRNVEDTELFFRLAIKKKLFPLKSEIPVAHRIVHEMNSIHDKTAIDRNSIFMYWEFLNWVIKENVPFSYFNMTFNRYVELSKLSKKRVFLHLILHNFWRLNFFILSAKKLKLELRF
jgi:glycosyltransferase involved in cell wall biosynthesis